MKLLLPIFTILAFIFLLLGITIFVAETLVILATQAFYDIYFHSGAWLAYPIIIVGIAHFVYLAFMAVCSGNKYLINKQLNIFETNTINSSLSNKIFIILIVLQILKLYLKKIRSN